MSINYRKTDPNTVGAQVMKERALDLEQRAFAMETEVECLVRLLEHEPTASDLVSMLEQARTDMTKIRRAALRAAGASPLSPEEIKQVRNVFFHGSSQTGQPGWLRQLEEAHAGRMALVNEATRQITLKGVDALSEEEKAEIEDDREVRMTEIERLEVRHSYCLEAMEKNEVEVVIEEEEDGEESFYSESST